MADALCGPSNPLQNIQKHASVDRTLQLDRLALNKSPSQAFRSSPAAGAGSLDAEFQAFQAGSSLGGGFQAHHTFQGQGKSFIPQPQLPGWATDFQRLNLNDVRSSPIPASRFQQEAPLQRNAAGGWHQEYLRQSGRHSPVSKNMNQTFGGNAWHPQSHLQPLSEFDMPATYMSPVAMQNQPEQDFETFIDDAAFERAFDSARMELAQAESIQMIGEQGLEANMSDSKLHLDEGMTDDVQPVLGHDVPGQSQPKIGSDLIMEESSRQEHNLDPDNEADELARTAGQLLDNLKHEQSRKFQNSTFLALMRQLRDKEVRVEGDQMVDNTQALHPGGHFYPDGTSRSSRHATVSYDIEHETSEPAA